MSQKGLLSTIVFVPSLYIIGWFLSRPLILFRFAPSTVSLIGTLITFMIFVLLMPYWFKSRWGINNAWFLLGLKANNSKKFILTKFLKGFSQALSLIFILLLPIIVNDWFIWEGQLSSGILINSLLLTIGVGFAEELLFRGWLQEELKLQMGFKMGLICQSIIFSLSHLRWDIPFLDNLNILLGLFLLGLILSFKRLADDKSLWGSIGMHGGFVGIWFILNNGLIEISDQAPFWIIGNQKDNLNPLSGIYGNILLLIFCCYFLINLKSKKFKWL